MNPISINPLIHQLHHQKTPPFYHKNSNQTPRIQTPQQILDTSTNKTKKDSNFTHNSINRPQFSPQFSYELQQIKIPQYLTKPQNPSTANLNGLISKNSVCRCWENQKTWALHYKKKFKKLLGCKLTVQHAYNGRK